MLRSVTQIEVIPNTIIHSVKISSTNDIEYNRKTVNHSENVVNFDT